MTSLRPLGLALSVALATTLAFEGAALAQNAPVTTASEAVYLKDGSVIRGRITEVKEGSHVLVQIDGGQVARIRWDFISRLERAGSTPAAPAGTPVPAPAPAPPPGQSILVQQETVILHIESPEPVTLETVEGRNHNFVCNSPCDIPVPLRGNYRIGGSVRSSRAFSLTGTPGERVVLTVDPTSKGGFVGGIVLLSLGGLSLLTGALVYLVAAAIDETSSTNDARGGKTAGGVMMLLGAGGVVGGIVLMSANGGSKVEQVRGRSGPPPEAKVRLPEFASHDSWGPQAPKPFVVPMTFRF